MMPIAGRRKPRLLLAAGGTLALGLLAGAVTGRSDLPPTDAAVVARPRADGDAAAGRSNRVEAAGAGTTATNAQGIAEPPARDARAMAARGDPAADRDLDLSRLQRAPREGTAGDLFAALSVAPPAPPAPAAPPLRATPAAVTMAPVAPPPPSAPPLPFRYLGRMSDGPSTVAFVGRGDEHWSVGAGATIEGTWRVESVTEGAVTFVHLPSGITQTLPVPPAS